ncbi:MAG: hypothetical protein Q9167_006782 [Letrouitia subvulpina]
MRNHSEPTETSPLLRHPSHVLQGPGDTTNSILPDGAADGHLVSGDAKPLIDQERQDEEDNDRENQYQGMPEVKARMKYIMPALSIGVFLAAADGTLVLSSYGNIGSDLKALNKTSWVSTAYVNYCVNGVILEINLGS